MNFDSILAQATCDLERFIPANHFWPRSYSLDAYSEIADPLLQNPHGLTPRELCATKAISRWVISETATRKSYAPRVSDVGTPSVVINDADELRLAALEHNAREAAHEYAEFVGDQVLIKKYPKPVWMENADTKPRAGKVEAAPTQWHLMAPPTKLIAAFGNISGMDRKWFNNVKDTPKLKAARHTAGVGGRKGREPLYLVFEVMQWLIDKRRRKGKPMQEATGWRLLKNQFPKVYAVYQSYDPEAD